jgi:hypothetical protein
MRCGPVFIVVNRKGDGTMKKGTVVILSAVLVLLVGGGAFYVSNAAKPAPAPVLAPAPAGAVVPDAAFMADYSQYMALREEVNRLESDSGLKQKRDQLEGMVNRLRRTVPKGYVWHEPSRTFAPAPPVPIPAKQ